MYNASSSVSNAPKITWLGDATTILTKRAIVLNEDENRIKSLSESMHLWVVATEKNKLTVESLWKNLAHNEFEKSHYDAPEGSTLEQQCILGFDLVEDHHSQVFDSDPWNEIHVIGCGLTPTLEKEAETFGNVSIHSEENGFVIKRYFKI